MVEQINNVTEMQQQVNTVVDYVARDTPVVTNQIRTSYQNVAVSVAAIGSASYGSGSASYGSGSFAAASGSVSYGSASFGY